MGDFASYSTYQPTEEDSAASAQQQQAPIITKVGGAQSIVINDGEAQISTRGGYSSFNAAEDFSAFDAGDWRSTARDSMGFPTNDITPDSVVTIGGVSSPVKVFVTTGILQKQGDGYVFAGNNANAGQVPQSGADAGEQQDESAKHETDAALMPSEVADTIDAAVEGMSQATIQNGMALGVAAALGEMSAEDVATGIARNTGLDPADATQRTNFIIDAYQAQADQFITGNLGISREGLPAFYEFAKQPQNKAALREALNKQLYSNSMAGWRPLVSNYFQNSSPSSEALKSRGFDTKQSSDGTQLVRIQGYWMSVDSASRAGLI